MNSYICLYEFIYFLQCKIKAASTQCKHAGRARSASCELAVQTASVQRELRACSANCERAVQAARAKPELTSCPDQAMPGCPNR